MEHGTADTMMPASKSYQAYCLECCGGGKDIGQPSSKKAASRECTGHINTYGHRVTLLYRPNPER